MKRAILFNSVLLIVMASSHLAFSQNSRVYSADWESLDQRPVPDWFSDAKFGIFIHWGVYSVPSWAPVRDVGLYARYAEWYWYRLINSESEGHQHFKTFHEAVYGPDFRYRDFAPLFTAEMYDPAAWADLFVSAGARYVVLTSKHHDGYALWPSRFSPGWNAADVGPRRDLAGELTSAVRQRGLKMGFYYSLYEWFNEQYHSDLGTYTDEYMWPQLKELVTAYEPDIVWTDGEWDHSSDVWKSEEFLAWLYNESPVRGSVVVNDRWGSETRSRHGGYYTTEYSMVHGGEEIDDQAALHPWEECRGIGGSFGYNRNERLEDYASSSDVVRLLIETVAHGGNLLLNVGPTADGRIPVIMQERLSDVGQWLAVNGEAIYGTRPWQESPSRSDVFFTQKAGVLYALVPSWPGDTLRLPMSELGPIRVHLLGHDAPLRHSVQQDVLTIQLPEFVTLPPSSRLGIALRIEQERDLGATGQGAASGSMTSLTTRENRE
ncbi:MAG: alpha-L-fucosidase [Bacteroidota bacterium]